MKVYRVVFLENDLPDGYAYFTQKKEAHKFIEWSEDLNVLIQELDMDYVLSLLNGNCQLSANPNHDADNRFEDRFPSYKYEPKKK
jgi:hypothetical protein